MCTLCPAGRSFRLEKRKRESNKEADQKERTGLTGEGKEDEEADVKEARGGEHRKEGQGNKRDLENRPLFSENIFFSKNSGKISNVFRFSQKV